MLPLPMEAVAGVTAMDWSVGGVTVRTAAGEVIPLRLAVMLLVPGATPVATPRFEMVATEVVAEVQVTEVVILAVLPSL